MARINREEYQILKSLDNKRKWIADEKPYNIAELIQEYEIENGMRYDFGKIKVVDIDTSKLATHNGYIYVKEREEEELKKDIEWANKEIKKVRDLLNNKRYEEEVDDFTSGVLSGLKKSLNILDELDEPEVLSQEWIDEHKKGVFMDGKGRKKNFVWVDDLQNLLVPTLSETEMVEITEEQAMEWLDNNDFYCHATAETVLANAVDKGELGYYGTKYAVVKKPVIPKFIADYIQEGKDLGCDLGTAMTVRTETLKDIRDYIKNNEELFARAWLDGYTIKKEHKYHAKIKGWENVTTGSEAFNWVYFKEKDTVGISKAVENKYQAVSFTKYDWSNLGINEDNADFVEVEELEE